MPKRFWSQKIFGPVYCRWQINPFPTPDCGTAQLRLKNLRVALFRLDKFEVEKFGYRMKEWKEKNSTCRSRAYYISAGQKCRSPVKMVLKKIHLMEFYGQNRKNVRKNAHFWAISFVKFHPKSRPRAISR